jgi:hypothetical protein
MKTRINPSSHARRASGFHAPRRNPLVPTLRVEAGDAERRDRCVPTRSVGTREHHFRSAVLVGLLCIGSFSTVAAAELDRCNVVWTTPGKDAGDSMPLGNGQVGINLWVEAGGDLHFYISRTDSLSDISRLLKVGGVRVSISPNPFVAGSRFKQELRLHDGVCKITAGEGDKKVTLSVFVDSDKPVIYVVGGSVAPVSVKVVNETWRAARRVLPKEEKLSAWSVHDAPFDLVESADVFCDGLTDAVAWYHRNEDSVFAVTLKHQGIWAAADKIRDPLLHRTFGGWIAAEGFRAKDNRTLETPSPVKAFAIRVAVPCEQTPDAKAWIDLAKRLCEESTDVVNALLRTGVWWWKFWDRSWVFVNGDQQLMIPGQQHPLRLGHDSQGASVFVGKRGRASIYGHVLSPADISRLAAAKGMNAGPRSKDRVMIAENDTADIPNSRFDFSRGMTLEAWIQPAAANAGRVFDKMTAGGTDGFIFDTHPGNALRLILGDWTLCTPSGTLKAGEWQHVAATADPATGALKLYLNGKVVAERPGDTLSSVTRGYLLQRYVQACGGRGTYPIKFNGSIFTVEPKRMGRPFNADWREWGDCHWWQNARFPCHPMLASGDFEMMDPLFRMYESVRPLCEARAKIYHGVRGCYFPETMTVWGTYSNGDYGWDRKGHQPKDVLCPCWAYAWNQGPELVALMLDRWDYTADEAFLKEQILPMAESVLAYFDTRFKKDAGGKIVLSPTQAVETVVVDVTNDAPTTAGLNSITARLCALPERLTTPEQREFFAKMKAASPAVPVEEAKYEGKSVRQLAPAEKYAKQRSNCENPELYAIWPFRLYGVGKPGLEEAVAAYRHRQNHLDVGWGYDGSCAAVLGMADEAARILKVKCANSHPAYRWPATWGPNFDWLPDQDHGSNLLETTQLMLLQCDGDVIRLLPAWPKKWDVWFKLHAPRGTTVECVYRSGRIERLLVEPESRRKDVVCTLAPLPGSSK